MDMALRRCGRICPPFQALLLATLLGGCTQDVTGPDRPPVAVAGPDQQVAVGQAAHLDGSQSFDPDGDDIARWEWTLVSGPDGAAPQALSAGEGGAAVLAPDLAGVWNIRLRVSDGKLWSQPDVAQVRVSGCSSDADCSDADVCNGEEVCVAGSCRAGTALDCADGLACTLDECDPTDGCQHPQAPDDTPCGNQFCAGSDLMSQACQSGACAGTVLVESCDDANPCTDDSCSPDDGCGHADNTATCDDGDPCSDQDVCAGGVCNPGQTNLDGDGDGFFDAACQDGDDCDDQDPLVNPGAFEGPVDDPPCSDGVDNDCDGLTDDADASCQGCTGDPDCDDQNVCNGAETCVNERCQPGSPLACDDGNACTINACDPVQGCRHPAVADGTECGSRSCDGLVWTRQVCQAGDCVGTAVQQNCDDGNECTADACQPVDGCQPSDEADGTECGSRSCDGLQYMRQACLSGSCSASQLVEDCDEGAACTTYACDAQSGCSSGPAPDDTVCGSPACNGLLWEQAICVSGACSGVEQLEDCDAGQECTTYACDDAAGCSDSPLPDGTECGSRTCEGLELKRQLCEGGACTGSEVLDNCSDGNECTSDSCDPAGGCTSTADEGAPCASDGHSCTQDVCDGAGVCTHVEQDGACLQNGQLCRPGCFDTASGCGHPPTGASLVCQDPIDLETTATSQCTFTLTGGDNADQAACVSCSAEIGVVVLDHTDFEDDANPGSCSLDGWQLLGSGACYNNGDQCPMQDFGNLDCCENFNCPIDFGLLNGEPAFMADKRDCNSEQWHLRKYFDATGVYDLQLCFDFADNGATNNDPLTVLVSDNDGNSLVLDCIEEGPRVDVNDTWYRLCYPLPAFTDNEDQVRVHFYLHSNDNDDVLFLDNITLKGLALPCPASYVDVFHEDFSGCADPLVDWNGWSVNNITSDLVCKTEFDCFNGSKRVQANNASGQFSRSLDLSQYHDVEVCFWMGDDGAGGGEVFLVEVDDTGTGADYKPVWGVAGNAGPDQDCLEVCANLSDQVPGVDGNPNVLLRFSLSSDGGKLDVDEVLVRGAQACDGAGVIEFTPGGLAVTPNEYPIDAENLDASQLPAWVTCSWDSPPPGEEVEASDEIHYVP